MNPCPGVPPGVWAAILLVLLTFSIPQSAQQVSDSQNPVSATGATEPAATFRSRSDLVLVPVVVRDRKGKSVPGLPQNSFRVEENGKEQTISLFEEVHAPTTELAGSEPDTRGFSNLPFDNTSQVRLTIVVLDLITTTPLQRADGRDQLIRFFSKALVANQPVSLLCITSKGLRLVHPFTTDKDALIQALKETPLGPTTSMPRQNVVTAAIRQLGDIAQAYAGIPGRKTMIFNSGNIPELTTELDITESSIYAVDLRWMWRSMIDANISVYPIQLMNWANDPTAMGVAGRPTDLWLRQFADATGGNRCLESNDLLGCLAQAVDDSRSYYMLGFAVHPADRKPGWRSLTVKVLAEHVSIHARTGFYYGTSSAGDAKSIHAEEINALASSLPRSGVPMFVKILPSRPSSGDKRILHFLMTIPFRGVTVDSSAANPLDLDVGAIALTTDTREAAESFHPVRGNPQPGDIQAWKQEGIKLEQQLELAPGSYDIRFLVRDNNADRIGTVIFPANVN